MLSVLDLMLMLCGLVLVLSAVRWAGRRRRLHQRLAVVEAEARAHFGSRADEVVDIIRGAMLANRTPCAEQCVEIMNARKGGRP